MRTSPRSHTAYVGIVFIIYFYPISQTGHAASGHNIVYYYYMCPYNRTIGRNPYKVSGGVGKKISRNYTKPLITLY